MKEKTEHHKSCLTERKKGMEILRGKYTQIWRIKMKKFAFKTKGKGRNGKKRLPYIKPDLIFHDHLTYISDITTFTELRAKGFHNFTCLQVYIKVIAEKKKAVDLEQEALCITQRN